LTRARDVASALSGALSSSDAVSQTLSNKTIDGNDNTIVTKRGGTSSRPSTPTTGTLYYNTDDDKLQIYDAGWTNVYQAPAVILSGISPSTAATTGTSITISGSYIQTGATVKFIGSDNTERSAATVSVTSGEELVATTPSLPVAYEPYDVKVVNPDGQNAILSDVLDAGGTPTWSTSSGTIATITEQASLNTSVSASDPDGTSIVYSSSNLPAWISLNSSTGALTGTAPDISSDTTYNFNITASDGVNTSSRSFAVVVNYIQPNVTVDYLVVAGGGGGGGQYSSASSGTGGGGAGGLRTSAGTSGGGNSAESALSLSRGVNYTVTVGAAGPQGQTSLNSSSKGGNSSISGSGITTVSCEGGGGGSYDTSGSGSYNGQSGGSGGGAASGPANGGSGAVGQGYRGGNISSDRYGSNGAAGGGAGGAGSDSSGQQPGGLGVASSITGSSITYATGGDNFSYSSGTTNRGNGGAGRIGAIGNQTGAAGGSGIVVLRYPSAETITVGAGLTSSTSTVGQNKVTVITAGTGNVSFA
jgi:hypothetical protein